MKKFVFSVAFYIISAFFIPVSVFFLMNFTAGKSEAAKAESDKINVYFKNENKTVSMNLEDYLCGVVAAEMPASFEQEALKAQAVAARSYALYKKKNPSQEHPDADVCTDFAHCKAYKNKDTLNSEWGEDKDKYTKKIENAVYTTSGEIITYDGEVAMAVFHSQSGGGKTENSADVWGGEIPYLVSVESHGEESAPNFYSTAIFSFDEFREKLLTKEPEMVINSAEEICEIQRSEGGSVKSIVIGNKEFSGRDIRTLFGLRSSCFKISADNESVTFEVTGYGHGVGMSQYGAETMAKEGFDYVDILTHYYTGTEVEMK